MGAVAWRPIQEEARPLSAESSLLTRDGWLCPRVRGNGKPSAREDVREAYRPESRVRPRTTVARVIRNGSSTGGRTGVRVGRTRTSPGGRIPYKVMSHRSAVARGWVYSGH